MKPILSLLIAAIALSACSTAPRERIVTKTVRVPVSVACVDKKDVPAEPAFAADRVDLDGDIHVLSKALLIDRQERKIYEDRLVAAFSGCVPP